MSEITLNNIDSIRATDRDSMFRELDSLPDNFTDTHQASVPSGYGKVNNILIGAMGGSGISGDIIETITADTLGMPLKVVKDFSVPSSVNESTLAIITSYSGNTEETLSLFEECLKRKAKIIAVSNGGELREKAGKLEIPFIRVNNSLMPRTAIGNLLNPLLHLFISLFPGSIKHEDISATRNTLKKLRNLYTLDSPCAENSAKKYALRIKNSRIFVLGTEKHTRASALRWKTQFNENSKLNIFFNTFPELCHNEIIGIVDDPDKNRNNVILALRSNGENHALKRSTDVALEICSKAGGAEIIEIRGEGDNVLSQIMSQCYLGDWTSYYLAILRGINPTPVDSITSYKKLNKERSGK